MRDFLYVSERKVDRMAATLPPRVAQRLRELRFNAGPVGAGIVLADQRAETAIAAVIEVERAIYDEFGVEDATNPELAIGDWFSAKEIQMAYGVQVTNNESGSGAAVFIAKMPNLHIFLSGSAEYLLDRSAPRADVGDSMSDPQAISRLLQSVTEDSDPRDSFDSPADFAWTLEAVPDRLNSEFSRFGLQPLKFLARVIGRMASGQHRDLTLVLGTPLFVEFARDRPPTRP